MSNPPRNSSKPPSPYALELVKRASALGKYNLTGVRLTEYAPVHLHALNEWMKKNNINWSSFTIGERDAAFAAYLANG